MPFPYFNMNPWGNDLPQNGGITGNIPYDPGIGMSQVWQPPDLSMSPVYGGTMPPDINQTLNPIFVPEHAAQDRVDQLLANMPQRNNPGFWRTLGASIVGLGPGGAMAAERAQYAPYYRQLEDWKTQFQPAYQAAGLERYSNENMRRYSYDVERQREFERKQDEVERANAIKEEQKNRELTRKERATEAYVFKQTHPDWKPMSTKGGTLKFYNPKDPSQTYDTGLDQGTMTDFEKYSLLGEQRMEQIGAQQTGATERAGMQIEGRTDKDWSAPYFMDGKWVSYNPSLNQTREVPGPGGTKPSSIQKPGTIGSGRGGVGRREGELPSQYQKRLQTRAAEIISKNPTKYQDWVTLDEVTKLPRIAEVGETSGGMPFTGWGSRTLDQQTHDELYDYIFGEDTSTPANTPNPFNLNTLPPPAGATGGQQLPNTAPPLRPGGPPVKQPPPPNQRTEGMPWTLPNGQNVIWHRFSDGHWGWAGVGSK